jgi:hypothetical protein
VDTAFDTRDNDFHIHIAKSDNADAGNIRLSKRLEERLEWFKGMQRAYFIPIYPENLLSGGKPTHIRSTLRNTL